MSTSVCASKVLRIEGENGAAVLEGVEEEDEDEEDEEGELEAAEKADEDEDDEGATWREGDVTAAVVAPARGREGWTEESAETIWLERL